MDGTCAPPFVLILKLQLTDSVSSSDAGAQRWESVRERHYLANYFGGAPKNLARVK
jgi:hypothetical protein